MAPAAIPETKKERGLTDAVAPISLALALFASSARAQALQDTQLPEPGAAAQPPVPVLSVQPSTPAAAPYISTNRSSLTAAQPQKEVEQAPQESKLEKAVTRFKDFMNNLFGQQTVDLVVIGGSLAVATWGSARLWLAALRKRFPDALSSYVLEPAPRDNGSPDEYLSTRTVTGPDISLKTIYGCSPHLRRAFVRAERYAKKHPELPILFFSSKTGPEIFTLLRTAISNSLADSAHVQAAVHNSGVRFNEAIQKISGQPPQRADSKLVPMEKAFLAFTFERYDAISARMVILPAKDVVSLLVDPERWFDAAHRVPVTQDRDAALRRLVRQLEISTTLLIDRPEIFKQYLLDQPKVLEELDKSSVALRRMLLLRPNESLEYVEKWMKNRATARQLNQPPPRAEDSALSPSEAETLARLLCNSTADLAKPGDLLPHSSQTSANGAKPPYTYERRSNWHAVLDIPVNH